MIDDARTTIEVEDGRVAMTADGPASVYLDTRDLTPLSGAETHVTIRAEGENSRAEIDLDGPALDAVIEELTAFRADLRETEVEVDA